MSDWLVEIQGVKKRFSHMGNELEVLRGIDLNLGRGEAVAIVGKSGAGKSTLLHCLGTLDLPSEGRIWLAGEELTAMKPSRLAAVRNQRIGFVFQFHHLLPEFNAIENVMMPALIRGMGRSEAHARALRLLKDVGLSHRATHRPGELSGGEQQRVAVARALSLDPPLLLADEPTGNLDTTTSEALHAIFFDLCRERGTTVVVVTHNMVFAERMPRVVRMLDGRVVEDRPGQDYVPGEGVTVGPTVAAESVG